MQNAPMGFTVPLIGQRLMFVTEYPRYSIKIVYRHALRPISLADLCSLPFSNFRLSK